MVNQFSPVTPRHSKHHLILGFAFDTSLLLPIGFLIAALVLIGVMIYAHRPAPSPDQVLKAVIMKHARKALGEVRGIIMEDEPGNSTPSSPEHTRYVGVGFSLGNSLNRDKWLPIMHKSAANLFRRVFSDPACAKVSKLGLTTYFDTYDTNANPAHIPVASFRINRSTAEEIKWDKFDPNNIPKLLRTKGEYTLYPFFK